MAFLMVNAGQLWADLPIWLEKTTPRDQKIIAIRNATPEEIDTYNPDGFTGLMVATSVGDKQLALLYLQHGASVFRYSKNKLQMTPLHIAVSHSQNDGARDLIPIFIAQGAFIDAPDIEGAQPIHYLVRIEDRTRRTQVLYTLVDYMANLNAQNFKGDTLLHYIVAAERDDAWMRPVLHSFPNRLNLSIKNKENRTPLEYAEFLVIDDEPNTVLSALRAPLKRIGGGFFGYKDTDAQGRTALMFAVYRGNLALAKKYIDQGATVNDRSRRSETALHYALMPKNPIPFLKLLLDNDANPNVVEQVTGYTPLHLVSLIDQPNVRKNAAKLLLEKGANLAAVDRNGNSLVKLAALRNDIDLIQFIFKLLPSIGQSDGKSPVELAQSYKQDIVTTPNGVTLYDTIINNLSS